MRDAFIQMPDVRVPMTDALPQMRDACVKMSNAEAQMTHFSSKITEKHHFLANRPLNTSKLCKNI